MIAVADLREQRLLREAGGFVEAADQVHILNGLAGPRLPTG